MTVAAIVLYVLAPIVVTNPQIDVWAVTQSAAHDLLHGIQPYTVRPPDFYHGAVDYRYSLTVYPYMPSTLLLFAPVVALLHDYRMLLAICLPVTIVLLRATCRALAVDRTLTGMITLAVLLHPRGLSLAAMGWSEPLMVLAAAASVFLLVRSRNRLGAAIAWLLLPALKQYVVVPPLLYACMLRPRPRVRTLCGAGAVAMATVVPFAIWAWRPTWNGIVFQFSELRAPRLDSTSVVALIAAFTGRWMSRWWSVGAQLAIGGIGYWRQRREGLGGMLLVSAAALYGTFLFGWQAFVNYYYFIAMLLLLAAIVAGAHRKALWKVSPAPFAQDC